MSKKLYFTLIILVMILVVSCAPKPAAAPITPTTPAAEEPEVVPQTDVTGESSVDEVAADISASVDTDEELDTADLDDIDDILAEIENI